MANFCQNCGAPLTGSPKFCTACGAAIAEAAPAPTTTPPETLPSSPATLPEQPPSPPAMGVPIPPPPPGCGPDYGPGGAAFGATERYVPDDDLVSMFLRYDNRLNRKSYILRSLALFAAIFVVAMILAFLSALLKSSAIRTMSQLISLVFAVPGLLLSVRRLHDLNRPTWWIIGNFIPFLNILFACYLVFFKGTDGPNRYGPDPLEGRP